MSASLVPQPSCDLNDPLNWSSTWKLITATSQLLYVWVLVCSALSLAPLFPLLGQEFHLNQQQLSLLTGTNVLTLVRNEHCPLVFESCTNQLFRDLPMYSSCPSPTFLADDLSPSSLVFWLFSPMSGKHSQQATRAFSPQERVTALRLLPLKRSWCRLLLTCSSYTRGPPGWLVCCGRYILLSITGSSLTSISILYVLFLRRIPGTNHRWFNRQPLWLAELLLAVCCNEWIRNPASGILLPGN